MLTLCSVIMLACSSSKISSSWKSPDYQAKKFQQIVIWAIVGENDSALKVKIENHFVNDLNNAGYNAIASYAVYGLKNNLKETTIILISHSNQVSSFVDFSLEIEEKKIIVKPAGS